jgi:hypothetical protein
MMNRAFRANKAIWVALVLVAAGLCLAAMVYVSYGRSASAFELKEKYSVLLAQTRNNLEYARWHAELQLRGKSDVVFSRDVDGKMAAAISLLKIAYEGGTAMQWQFEHIENEEAGVLLKTAWVEAEKLRDQLLQLQTASDANELATVGPTYQLIADNLSKLDQHFAAAYREKQTVSAGMMWLVVTLLICGFSALAIIVYRQTLTYQQRTASYETRLQGEAKRSEQTTRFMEAISSGNFDIELTATGDDDTVTHTLIAMRDKLKENAETEQRRTWANTGLAQIGEILRATGSATDLYDNIIRFIVKYSRSNQGGLFVFNDDDEQHPHLDLVACYAFERKKFLTKKLNLGDGIVGQCFQERQRIYLTEVPEEYVQITSGLGGAKPTTLLVVPLKVNDQVHGVIELASFHKYADHEIELIEKFAESVGSTIAAVKTNERTRELLEQTQQQAEEMKSQEEEMRQNMEELSATQEEMLRKEREYINRIAELETRVGENVG